MPFSAETRTWLLSEVSRPRTWVVVSVVFVFGYVFGADLARKHNQIDLADAAELRYEVEDDQVRSP